MNNSTRAAVAYIGPRLVSGLRKSSVYDYTQSKHINIDGDVSTVNVNV